MTRRGVRPLIAALAAAAVAALTLLLVGAAGALHTPPSGGTGGVLSSADRAAVGAVAVGRGAAPAPVDPAVDFADPESVARAYLAAARSIRPDDAGRTQLRAAGYAEPGSPAAAVGVIVLDPPPAGELRTATVTGLQLTDPDDSGTRRRYRAEVGTATRAPGGAQKVALVTSRIVLARQPDGRWLVADDTVETPDLPAGED